MTVSSTFDNVLSAHVGELGRTQLVLVLIASLCHIPMAMIAMLMVFTSLDPISNGAWRCMHQDDELCSTIRQADPINRDLFCDMETTSWQWTNKAYSLLTTYSLTCGKEWQVDLLNSFYFVGLAMGGTLFGAFSDRYGRKLALYVSCALAAALTAVGVAAPVFWLHALCRVIGAAALQGLSLADVVFCTEIVGPTYRGRIGVLTQSYFIVGECILALSWLVPDWRTLSLVCAGVGAAFLLTAPLMVESPRWLLARGRAAAAANVMACLARHNKREATEQELLDLLLLDQEQQQQQQQQQQKKPAYQGLSAVPRTSAHGVAGPALQQQQQHQELAAAAAAPLAAPASLPLPVKGDPLEPSCVPPGRDNVRVFAVGCPDDDAGFGTEQHLDVSTSEQPQGLRAAQQHSNGTSARPDGYELASWQHPQHDADVASAESTRLMHCCSTQPTAAPLPLPCATSKQPPRPPQQQQPEPVTLGHALRHAPLRRSLLLLMYIICTCVLVYYGVSFGLGALQGSIYLNFFLTSIAEAPATVALVLLVDRCGRLTLVLAGMLISGAACVICGASASAPAAVQVVFAMLGKFGASGAWALLYVYAAEVFPTPVRSVLCGIVFQGARAGGIAAPFVFMLGRKVGVPVLPFLLMGVVTLLGAAACLYLPESRGSSQPETLADVDKLAARTPLAQLRERMAARRERRRCAGSNGAVEHGHGVGEVGGGRLASGHEEQLLLPGSRACLSCCSGGGDDCAATAKKCTS